MYQVSIDIVYKELLKIKNKAQKSVKIIFILIKIEVNQGLQNNFAIFTRSLPSGLLGIFKEQTNLEPTDYILLLFLLEIELQ